MGSCNTANNNVCQDGMSATGVIAEDEGIVVVDPATTFNFIGGGVTVTDGGGGVADVTIPGGGTAGSFRLAFTDGDLAAGILPVNHLLASNFNTLAVYDDNDNLVLPDEVENIDANNIDVDLSTFQTAGGGAIQNTWNLVVVG